MMTPLVSVALGGALGASLRYLTGQTLARSLGAGFPWGTFAVNILGSFLMGFAFVILAQQTRLSPLIMTGVLGGFTTFSAFSLDAYQLCDKGEVSTAALYIIGSVVISIAALIAGIVLARSFAT